MSIFSRLFKIGQAKMNKAVDQLEKPELMLEQAIKDKETQVREAKKAVMAVIATEKQTRALLLQDRDEQRNWEAKAELAVKAGKDELAVKALSRSADHEKKAVLLEKSWEAQRAGVENLKRDIARMEDELAEFKRNKDFIIAQSRTAEVKKQIYAAKAQISSDKSADDLMARMKAKAERLSYEADAVEEMAASSGDSLDKEFAGLASISATSEVKGKLEALKARLA